MSCNPCGAPLEREVDFARGWCERHETLIEAGVVRELSGIGWVFEAPPDWLASVLRKFA